jgi:hypothetical protein
MEFKDSPVESAADSTGPKWLDGANNALPRANFGFDDTRDDYWLKVLAQ